MAVTTRFLASRWSGFLPVTMSIASLAVLAIALAAGVDERADEGTFTHIWQILIAGQAPIVGWFAVRWLPTAPQPGLVVLASQIAGVLLALTPVYLLHL